MRRVLALKQLNIPASRNDDVYILNRGGEDSWSTLLKKVGHTINLAFCQ